jgi:hypothetical protein
MYRLDLRTTTRGASSNMGVGAHYQEYLLGTVANMALRQVSLCFFTEEGFASCQVFNFTSGSNKVTSGVAEYSKSHSTKGFLLK